jgi:CBS domain-containing protein
MTTNYLVVPSDITLSRLVEEHIFPAGHRLFMVGGEGRFEGILTLNNIKSVSRQDWGVTRVKDIMTPLDKLKAAHPGQDALSILEQMNEGDVNQMPVVSEGRVIGLVIRDDLMSFLRTRSELGM